MKNIIAKLAIVLCIVAAAASCQKFDLSGADNVTLRVALTPDPGVIATSGTVFEAAAVVAKGMEKNVDWTVSVDNAPAWVTVETITVTQPFTGTYAGDDAQVTHKGVKVMVSQNDTGAKRIANLRFTVADGGSVIYTITQSK